MSGEENFFEDKQSNVITDTFSRIYTIYKINTEKYIFNVKERYIFTGSLFFLFFLRIVFYQGFYVIAYIQGIFLT